MQILFVSRPITPPWNEGSKNLAWQIATGMQRHTPHLMTIRATQPPAAPLPVMWQRPYTSSHLSTMQKLRLLQFLWITRPSWDLYHFLFVPTPVTSRLLRRVVRRHGLPSVQTIPSLPEMNLTPEAVQSLFFADKVVTYTEETAVSLQSAGVQNVLHINVGIDTDQFPAPDDPAILTALGLPSRKKLLLYAGEYTRLGAIEQLRRIMPLTLDACEDCHFVIACRLLQPADAVNKAAFQEWVAAQPWAARVHFLGEIPNFFQLMQACHLFLFPVTDMTGKIDTPLTLLEAMGVGLPVLTYDVRPLPEIFAAAREAVIPTTDAAQMAAAILRLTGDEAARQRLGRKMQAIIRQQYSLPQMVASYEALYDGFS